MERFGSSIRVNIEGVTHTTSFQIHESRESVRPYADLSLSSTCIIPVGVVHVYVIFTPFDLFTLNSSLGGFIIRGSKSK